LGTLLFFCFFSCRVSISPHGLSIKREVAALPLNSFCLFRCYSFHFRRFSTSATLLPLFCIFLKSNKVPLL
jgi:hypothetical protein